jgi:hypothetical protein
MEYRKITLNIQGLKHNYTIDTLGVVRNEDNNKTLKGTSLSKNNRYVKIHLDKFYALHRLVALHFIPNPDNLPCINHKDGNRYNNTVSNLEWCTQQDNVKHAYKTKLKTNEGEKNPTAKLTEEDVRKIWALKDSNLTARQIRDRLKLNVSIDAIKLVRQGKNWSHITKNI